MQHGRGQLLFPAVKGHKARRTSNLFFSVSVWHFYSFPGAIHNIHVSASCHCRYVVTVVIARNFLKHSKDDNLWEMHFVSLILIYLFIYFFWWLKSQLNCHEVFARLDIILIAWRRVRSCQSRRDILIVWSERSSNGISRESLIPLSSGFFFTFFILFYLTGRARKWIKRSMNGKMLPRFFILL